MVDELDRNKTREDNVDGILFLFEISDSFFHLALAGFNSINILK